MATCGAFQTQLSSILEVLVRAAVVEISKLVDDKCAFLHLEISRKQSENEMLKRKLMVMESKNAQLQQGYENYLERGASLDNSCASAAEVKFPAVHENAVSVSFSIKEESPDEPLWISESAQTNSSSVQYPNTASSESQGFDKNCQMDPTAVNQPKTIDFSNNYNSSHSSSSNMNPDFTIKTEKDEHQTGFNQDNCQHSTGKQTQHANNHNNNDFSMDEQSSHLWSSIIDENDIESGFPEFSSVVDEYSNAYSETEAKSNSIQQAQSQRACNGLYNNEYQKTQSDNFPISLLQGGQREGNDRPSQSSSNLYAPNSSSNIHHHNNFQNKTLSGQLRSYVCMQCGKAFGRLHQFKLHQQCHKRKRAFWCAFCGKGFQCSSHLSIHHRTHTGEKPYVCGQCGKRFTQQSSLRVHQRTHSGERPYSCSQCGKSFILMHHLKRHRVIHNYCG